MLALCPAAQNLSPPPDSCRQAILFSCVFLCFLPPGEILKSGVGITFGVPICIVMIEYSRRRLEGRISLNNTNEYGSDSDNNNNNNSNSNSNSNNNDNNNIDK